MQDFPANSAKARAQAEGAAEPKRIERVTSGEAVRRKKGLGRQFKETFVGGSARMAFEYMTMEVIIPAIQDTLIDAFQGGVERLIRGEARARRSSVPPSYSNLGHVNYQRMSAPTSTRAASPRPLSRRSRTRHDFGEIVIPSRQEAEEVIDRMFDILSRYGSVAVSDLYELTGIASSHVDHKWGWTELRGAKAARLRDGNFLLDLPEPEPLD